MWRCGRRLIKVLSKSVWMHLDKMFFNIVHIAIEWDEGRKEKMLFAVFMLHLTTIVLMSLCCHWQWLYHCNILTDCRLRYSRNTQQMVQMEDVKLLDALAITVLVVTILLITVLSFTVLVFTVMSFTAMGIVFMVWGKEEEERGKGGKAANGDTGDWGGRGHQVDKMLWGNE